MKFNKKRNEKKKEERKKEVAGIDEDQVVAKWSDRIESALSSEREIFLFYLKTEFNYLYSLVRKELQRRENVRLAPKTDAVVVMDDGGEA